MRYIAALPGQNETAWDRFWAKVEKSDGCWTWTASRRYGYGQFRLGGTGSSNLGAHVVAYRWLVGDIPQGKVVDHLCRNRACVRPDHLELVTPEENSTRGMQSRHAEQETCKRGHLWSENAYYPPSGYRICRACQWPRQREYIKRWREKQREAGNG